MSAALWAGMMVASMAGPRAVLLAALSDGSRVGKSVDGMVGRKGVGMAGMLAVRWGLSAAPRAGQKAFPRAH